MNEAPSNLAIIGRYVLTPYIFDRIDEPNPTSAMKSSSPMPQKLDSIYGVTFEGTTYYIGNRLEWLKTSIEFVLNDSEFRDDLDDYMKNLYLKKNEVDLPCECLNTVLTKQAVGGNFT